jgi:hypothetical protein
VIKAHSLIDIKTRLTHPESNGIVERFNSTARDYMQAWDTCRQQLGVVANQSEFENDVAGQLWHASCFCP